MHPQGMNSVHREEGQTKVTGSKAGLPRTSNRNQEADDHLPSFLRDFYEVDFFSFISGST